MIENKNREKKDYIKIRISKDQKKEWKKICTQKQISLTSLIIDSVENRILDDERRKIAAFIEKQDNVFVKIETNINQVAKIANAQKFITENEMKKFSEILTEVAKLNLAGDLQITFTPTIENNYVVSVLLKNEQCRDEARKSIPPLNLRGTAEELDNGFFEHITTPLQTASGLMMDMESFMKQLEEAKKKSAMEKEKSDKEKREKEAKDKKYKEAFQKAEELEKENKYKEAWSALPKISEFPEYTETIRKKQDDYEKHFAPSLFSENLPTEV